jgi:hypothetical protein
MKENVGIMHLMIQDFVGLKGILPVHTWPEPLDLAGRQIRGENTGHFIEQLPAAGDRGLVKVVDIDIGNAGIQQGS